MEYFENYDVKQIEDMEFFARQVVEGFIIGLHKSPFHGFSVEFAEHRLYNPGESTKNIDWKVYGRTDKMFVKKYEEETNLRCHIIIDTSSSMYFPSKEEHNINKLEFSALAAASLMNLFRRQRDAFGLSLFDDLVHVHTPEKSSLKHYRLLLNYLDQLIKDDKPEKKSRITDSLHSIADRVHKRSLIIIFSDMLTEDRDIDEIFSAIQHLKYNKHEVILFHTVDKKLEEEFDFENRPYLFVDKESGERVKLHASEVRDLYYEKMQAFKSMILTTCLQYKIDLVETDIREGFYPVLQNYLVKRKKMNVR